MIPIKCFTCGKVLADLYRKKYLTNVLMRKKEMNQDIDRIQYFTPDNCEKTVEGVVMDEIGVVKICCRRVLMTHRDI
jgi:DNA-directed RNA polymerase subunit N (RpoN/RPB10)